MSRRVVAFALGVLAVLTLLHRDAAGEQVWTPLQTASIPAAQTNWGHGTSGPSFPLIVSPFDPSLGTLTGVAITMTMTVTNDYTLVFANTPTPTMIAVGTTNTSDSSILLDPTKVATLTDGPTVTLLGPDAVTPIFGAPAATVPVNVQTRTSSTAIVYSSTAYPSTDPRYIPPDNVTIQLSQTLDASNLPSLMSQFIGTKPIDLPILADAYSSFYSSSNNGGGAVVTTAGATVTVQYQFTPALAPEPSSLLLMGLGAGLGMLAAGRSRRAAGPCVRDRA